MIHNLVSVGKTISKLYRDFRISDPQYNADAIEWVGEALGSIGHGVQFTQEEQSFDVVDYKVALPRGLFRLKDVYYLGDNDEVRPAQAANPSVSRKTRGVVTNGFSYVVQGGYVHTSKEVGKVYLVYDAIAVGEDGYPLVPDHPDFQNALVWYVIHKMITGGWQHPSSQVDFRESQRQWETYCGRARTQARIPTIGDYQEFLENWVGLLSPTTRRDEGFDSVPLSGPSYGKPYYPGSTGTPVAGETGPAVWGIKDW